MHKHVLPLLTALLISLSGCGGDATTPSGNEGGAGVPKSPGGDGYLKVTVDGEEWVCEGEIRNQGITLNKKDLHLVLVGRLPAKGDRPATNLHVALVKKTRDEGRYELVSNQATLDVMEGDLGYVKVYTISPDFTAVGRKGNLTFTKLVTTEEGFKNYGVLHAVGTFEGTFGKGQNSYEIKGSFEFAR